MDAQELRNLSEAYLEVYSEIDEEQKPLPTARMANQRRNAWNKAKGAVETGNEDERKKQIARYNAMSFPETRRAHLKSKTQQEQVDIYDIILSHLIDEGYAETPESAEAIMVNMSEEWRDSVVEANKGEREFNTPNWEKVYDRNARDYGSNHTITHRGRTKSGASETPNQTTHRLGKERVQAHKDTRGMKKNPGEKESVADRMIRRMDLEKKAKKD